MICRLPEGSGYASPLGLGRGQIPPSTACDCSTRPRLPPPFAAPAEGMLRSTTLRWRGAHASVPCARLGPPLQRARRACGLLSAPRGCAYPRRVQTRLCNAWIGSPGPLGYAAWTFPRASPLGAVSGRWEPRDPPSSSGLPKGGSGGRERGAADVWARVGPDGARVSGEPSAQNAAPCRYDRKRERPDSNRRPPA